MPSVEDLLYDLLREQQETNGLLRELIEQSVPEEELFCPPLEHEGKIICPGGLVLKRHAPQYERDRDRLYHPLPPESYFMGQGVGGVTQIKNHNVWRSRAFRSVEAARAASRQQSEEAGEEDLGLCPDHNEPWVRSKTGKVGHILEGSSPCMKPEAVDAE